MIPMQIMLFALAVPFSVACFLLVILAGSATFSSEGKDSASLFTFGALVWVVYSIGVFLIGTIV